MPTFKVVLDGLELSDEQSRRISQSIQRSVMHELAELDTGVRDEGTTEPSDRAVSFALLPISKGQTMGLVATEPPDEKRLAEIVASEFGG